MATKRRLLLTTVPAMAALGLGLNAGGLLPEAVSLTPAAYAQANPCGPANPCAAVNPCAPCSPCGAAAVISDASNPFDVAAGLKQAVYGDAMPEIVKNYLRAAPYVGTGGVVCCEEGYTTLAELGFKTVVNLNTEKEGSDKEARLAEAAGLRHINIEVATKAPTMLQVGEFAAVVNDATNYPILVHCQSSNRVGAMWALYRATHGVPPMIAIQEGRTVGLKPSREAAVRKLLKLPAE